MEADRPVVEFDSVSVEGNNDISILRDLNFAIRSGDKVLVYGESGSGKSTLLYSLLGRNRISTGAISINGTVFNEHNAHCLRKSISFVPQEPLMGADTVKAALLLPFTFKANRNFSPTQEELLETLEFVGLGEKYMERSCSRLSGGEKQRLSLARALLLKREIMLIDEPASALDTRNEKMILDILTGMKPTVLVISHNPSWKKSFSKYIHVENGTAILLSSEAKVNADENTRH